MARPQLRTLPAVERPAPGQAITGVGVFGLGYVGCVTAACLAREGFEVIGVDVGQAKVNSINQGKGTVIEGGLDPLVREAVEAGRLRATTQLEDAVLHSDLSLISVGTPSQKNGSPSLDQVEEVCRQIGKALAKTSKYHVVVVRSTILPGTTESRLIPILEETSHRRAGRDFGVCFNPEFLREGSSLRDFFFPPFVVIGQLDKESGDRLERLYEGLKAPIVRTPIKVAEMIKYTSNAFHALKVTFANEIGSLCKEEGIDSHQVMNLFCQDTQLNISPYYLKPGFAFGGSCLPKDVRALLYWARGKDVECDVLASILRSNEAHLERAVNLVQESGGRRVALLGLSFKAGTDDVRESPAMRLAEALLGRGYTLTIYDRNVNLARLTGSNKSFLEKELPHICSLMCPSLEKTVAEAEVVVVCNSSDEFKAVPAMLKPGQTLIDLVRISQEPVETRGRYEGICW